MGRVEEVLSVLDVAYQFPRNYMRRVSEEALQFPGPGVPGRSRFSQRGNQQQWHQIGRVPRCQQGGRGQTGGAGYWGDCGGQRENC